MNLSLDTRLTLDKLRSNDTAPAGLHENGDAWEDDAYAAAAERIDLQMSINVSTLSVFPEAALG